MLVHDCTDKTCFLRKRAIYQLYQQKKSKQGISEFRSKMVSFVFEQLLDIFFLKWNVN